MDIITMLGSFGGVWELLSTVVGVFMATFSSMKYRSLIANRFYQWNMPESFKSLRVKKIKKEDEIPIPRCLCLWHCFYNYVNCCCRSQAYLDYLDTL
jgi:hypothetical protein